MNGVGSGQEPTSIPSLGLGVAVVPGYEHLARNRLARITFAASGPSAQVVTQGLDSAHELRLIVVGGDDHVASHMTFVVVPVVVDDVAQRVVIVGVHLGH